MQQYLILVGFGYEDEDEFFYENENGILKFILALHRCHPYPHRTFLVILLLSRLLQILIIILDFEKEKYTIINNFDTFFYDLSWYPLSCFLFFYFLYFKSTKRISA